MEKTNKTKGLKEYRSQINEIDNRLIELLDMRLEVAKEIGNYKRENNLPVFNEERENEIYEKIREEAKEIESIIEIYAEIMKQSKDLQK